MWGTCGQPKYRNLLFEWIKHKHVKWSLNSFFFFYKKRDFPQGKFPVFFSLDPRFEYKHGIRPLTSFFFLWETKSTCTDQARFLAGSNLGDPLEHLPYSFFFHTVFCTNKCILFLAPRSAPGTGISKSMYFNDWYQSTYPLIRLHILFKFKPSMLKVVRLTPIFPHSMNFPWYQIIFILNNVFFD